MLYFLVKVVLSAVLIAAISEISKRSSLVGGLVASLPLVSLLAMIWLYIDTRDVTKVADLSRSVFWLVLPSLPMFLVLPRLLRTPLGFTWSLVAAAALTVACYGAMLFILARLGVKL
ncbi:MAG: DUF3147 family protein [Planctomycetota bacterium]|jgi:hypothetical protein